MSALLNTTNEAEGLPRWRFTVDDLYAMTEAGILAENERVELIGGELVPMQSKGSFHERLKGALNLYWAQRLPPDLLFITETSFRLSRDTLLEPDFVFYPKAGGWDGLNAETAQLVVELAHSSLAYDLGRKAALCAGFGICELWVINAVTRDVRIHSEPSAAGYRRVENRTASDRIVPERAPDLAVVLGELALH